MYKSSKKPIRAKIRRIYVPNATYFITAVTKQRTRIFSNDVNLELLQITIRAAKEFHPFIMRAFVFLPEHFHLLIFVPENTNISKLLQSIQRNYTLNYKKAHQINHSISLWQRGFWDHVIRNDRDFINHFHYIHFNPVKHGYVTRPLDYLHSSFHEYVKREWYEPEWGSVEPESLNGLDFE